MSLINTPSPKNGRRAAPEKMPLGEIVDNRGNVKLGAGKTHGARVRDARADMERLPPSSFLDSQYRPPVPASRRRAERRQASVDRATRMWSRVLNNWDAALSPQKKKCHDWLDTVIHPVMFAATPISSAVDSNSSMASLLHLVEADEGSEEDLDGEALVYFLNAHA